MTESLGYAEPDKLPVTLATIMTKMIDSEPDEEATELERKAVGYER